MDICYPEALGPGRRCVWFTLFDHGDSTFCMWKFSTKARHYRVFPFNSPATRQSIFVQMAVRFLSCPM